MAHEIEIKTQGPIHIGNDEIYSEYSRLEFIEREGELYRIRIDRCFALITDKYPDATERFIQWSNKKMTIMEQVREKIKKKPGEESRITQSEKEKLVKEREKIRQGMNLPVFIEEDLKDRELKESLLSLLSQENDSLYRYKMSIRGDIRHKDFRMALRNALGELYIPGTTIKGLIRTALLYDRVGSLSEDILKQIARRVENIVGRNDEKLLRDLDKELIEHAFLCGYKKRGGAQLLYDDIRYDILKFIHVSDTNSLSHTEGIAIPIDAIVLSDMLQRQFPAVEAIPSGKTFKCMIGIDLACLENILNARRGKEEETEWVGLEEKVEAIFGVTAKDIANAHTPEARKTIEATIISGILKKMRAFGNEQKSRENGFFFPTSEKEYNSSTMMKFLKAKQGTHAKIGWGSGFYATTIFLAAKDKPLVKSIFTPVVNTLRGPKKGANATSTADYPRSKKVFINENRFVEPFGWVAITSPLLPEEEHGIGEQRLGPLKKGNVVRATVIDSQGGKVKVRLKSENEETLLFNYASGIPIGTEVEVSVTDMKDDKVTSIRFNKKI